MIDEKHLEKILKEMYQAVLNNPNDVYFDGYAEAITDIRNAFLPDVKFGVE
jgi:hypothetical protein